MVNSTFFGAELEQPLQNSYHYIARVALDHTSMKAVVLFGYACPALCGAHETIFHLEKHRAKWEIKSGVRLWIS